MIAVYAISLSACAGPRTSNTAATNGPLPTPALQAASQAFRFGDPVESESHALIAAQAALGNSFGYSEPLTAVSVEPISYGEYSKRMGGGSDRQADMKTWLVLYFDKQWQAIPPRPDVVPSPPFRGCVSVVINAADGLPLEVGGPVQPGRVAQCDQ